MKKINSYLLALIVMFGIALFILLLTINFEVLAGLSIYLIILISIKVNRGEL